MTNFFSSNFSLPFSMNNWFMPNWSFPSFNNFFQLPAFNVFDSWFPSFDYNFYTPQISQPSLFYQNYTYLNPIDTFIKNKTDKNDSNSSKSTTSLSSNNPVSKMDFSKSNLKLDDYNALKGQRLANTALNRSVGWTGYCARYVKNSIQASGLGSYQYGHAYQMSNILRNNKNFKEISPEGVNVKDLPAGCVLVYGKGVEGYSNNYGHTEITTGDGRAVSDGITRNLHKKPSAIFIPV